MARSLVLAALLLFGGGVPQAQDFTDPSTALSRAVGPFLQKNCQGCHSTSLPSGSVDMQQLIAAPNSLVDHRDTWENIAYQLRSGRMPPDAAPKTAQAPAEPPTTDWFTYGYDAERTNWARGETRITKDTARQLQLTWRLL